MNGSRSRTNCSSVQMFEKCRPDTIKINDRDALNQNLINRWSLGHRSRKVLEDIAIEHIREFWNVLKVLEFREIRI